jgi:metal-responsive CopG/Arc/MetJ family transcriptional regulator
MKTLSLKLDDDIFSETEKMTAELKMARNRYINEALRKFNEYNRKRALRAELQRASKAVMANSMEVLAEFEALEEDYEDYAV